MRENVCRTGNYICGIYCTWKTFFGSIADVESFQLYRPTETILKHEAVLMPSLSNPHTSRNSCRKNASWFIDSKWTSQLNFSLLFRRWSEYPFPLRTGFAVFFYCFHLKEYRGFALKPWRFFLHVRELGAWELASRLSKLLHNCNLITFRF